MWFKLVYCSLKTYIYLQLQVHILTKEHIDNKEHNKLKLMTCSPTQTMDLTVFTLKYTIIMKNIK